MSGTSIIAKISVFNCKMPMHVLFQIKFPQNRCLVTSWDHTGIHHIGAPDDLIVFIVFHQFGVILEYLV